MTVSRELLDAAYEEIGELNVQLAVADSVLAAQRDYYIELLSLKDRHIDSLREALDDASKGPNLLDRVTDIGLGYALRALTEPQ